MDHFFADADPEDAGSPTGRADTDHPLPDLPAPAAGTDTADRPFSRLHRRPRPGGTGADGIAGAMRYRAEEQLVPSGGTLLLETGERWGEGLSLSGDGGLLLAPGRYDVRFVADGKGDACGAVFSLNGATLPFTAAQLSGTARIALSAILDLRAAAILSVENNCPGAVSYRSAVLTALQLK